jgi:hypothetical protein
MIFIIISKTHSTERHMQAIVIIIKTKTIMAKLAKYEKLDMSLIANHSKVKVHTFRFQLKC